MSNEENPNARQDHENIDWHRLLLRKDRPLPKSGCSVAFYIVLLLLFVFLAFFYIRYRQQ